MERRSRQLTMEHWSPCTERDLDVLHRQLGRAPRGVLAVARRCRYGAPQVIVSDPLPRSEDGKVRPFPTLFWLSCPYLIKAVGGLESQGHIAAFQERLRVDPAFAREMAAAHRRYAQLRLAVADPAVLHAVRHEAPEQYRVIAERGVAGIAAADGVKCLHTHLADYLGRGAGQGGGTAEPGVNPVGRAVCELLLARGVDLAGSPACRACAHAGRPAPRDGEPVAAIDIGSHSVRLWLGRSARRDGSGKRPGGWQVTRRRRALTRLGAGAATHESQGDGVALSAGAVQATLEALAAFARECRAVGATPVAAATAAVRRARDGGAFLRRVFEETGISAPLVSGEEEASLAFLGAVRSLPAAAGGGEAADGLCAVVDVGGGSTEVAVGSPGGDVLARASVPLGAVQATEAFRLGAPADPGQVAKVRSEARRQIEQAEALSSVLDEYPLSRVIAVGGTATSLAAVKLGLTRYEPERVHGTRLGAGELAQLVDRLAGLDLEARRQVPGLEPERADVIVAGGAVLCGVLAALGTERFTVSEADILEGLLWRTYPGNEAGP